MPKPPTQKRLQALEVVENIITFDQVETNVTMKIAAAWSYEDLYEWLEAWGYEWRQDEQAWIRQDD